MKMIEKGAAGCAQCGTLPLLSDDDYQWLRSGQSLHSLMAQAVEEAAVAAAAPPAEEEPKSAVDAMNSAMDSLEALFGFGAAPAAEPEPEPEQEEALTLKPVKEIDAERGSVMYRYDKAYYLRGRRQDYEIVYCPFCGKALAQQT